MSILNAHIEVWFDGTSGDDLYCVSLCQEDGAEVKCLSTHEDESEAKDEGRRVAKARGLPVLFREESGSTRDL